MVLGWIESTVIPFVVFYAAVYHFWQRGAPRRVDFEARRASARRLEKYLASGWVIVVLGTLVLAFVTGFGTSLSTLVSESEMLQRLLPSYVLPLAAVVYGPLLGGTLLVYDSVAPYRDAVFRRTLTRRESLRMFVNEYVALTLPIFGLLVLVHWAPAGIAAGLTVAVAVLGYHAVGHYETFLLSDVRDPTAEERGIFEGVAGPDDASVHVLEAANARYAMGLTAGFVPGHRAVFLTDYLVDELAEGEIQAVLAHEYGHLRDHAVLRTALLRATALGAGVWVWSAGIRIGFTMGPLWDAIFIGGVVLGIYVGAIRRLERNDEFNADRFAAEHVGPDELARALVRITELNDAGLSGNPLELIVDSRSELKERIRRLRPELLWSTPPIPTRT